MKQLIIKAQLTDFDAFETKLDRQGYDFGAIYWQHDRIYTPSNYQKDQKFPRLIMRTELHAIDEPPTYQLILKRHTVAGHDIIESTTVTDYVATVNLIVALGFRYAGEVSRRRQSLTTKDNVTIHLDQLDPPHDGAYVKLEAPLAAPLESAPAVTTAADLATSPAPQPTASEPASPLEAPISQIAHTLGLETLVKSPYFEL